jgi:hypothetical protein
MPEEILTGQTSLNAILLVAVTVLLALFLSRRQKKIVHHVDTTTILTPTHEQKSFSDLFILRWHQHDGDSMVFGVYSAENDLQVFQSEPIQVTECFYMVWGVDDNIWLYRKDAGLRYWEKTDTKWEEKLYSRGPKSPPPPKLLLRLFPELYN